MADKEYTVIEILDVLRRQKAGDNISAIARSIGMDRKTVRKYIRIAQAREALGSGLVSCNLRQYVLNFSRGKAVAHRI
ncbi:MAG: hypothetical protein OHK006_21960 [Thermodesulfovibrionales bacterium]